MIVGFGLAAFVIGDTLDRQKAAIKTFHVEQKQPVAQLATAHRLDPTVLKSYIAAQVSETSDRALARVQQLEFLFGNHE